MFEYLATVVAMWQERTIQAEEINDMAAFLEITAASMKQLHPFFRIRCAINESDAQDKYLDVAAFRGIMNINFYRLMAALNEDEAILAMKQMEKDLSYPPVINISGNKY